MFKHYLLPAVLFLFMPVVQAGEIYKWTDENGRVHYGDKPLSENAQEVQLGRHPGSGLSTTDAPAAPVSEKQRQYRQRRLVESLEADRREKEAIKAKQKEVQKTRERNCNRARVLYKAAYDANLLYSFDEKGNRYFLNETQRQKVLAEDRAMIAKWCD